MESDKHLLFIVSLSSLLFFYSAEATCVPRNFTHHSHTLHSFPPSRLRPVSSTSSHHVSSPSPHHITTSLSPRYVSSWPTKSPPPPYHVSSPPSKLPFHRQPEKPSHTLHSFPPSRLRPVFFTPSHHVSSPSPHHVATSLSPRYVSSWSAKSPPPPHHVSSPPSKLEASPPFHSQPEKPTPAEPIALPPNTLPLFFPPLLPSMKIDAVIKNICGSTDHPAICLNSVVPFLSSGKVDPISILEMEIKACNTTSNIALDVVTKIASNPSTPSGIVSSFSDCKDSYSDAIDNLQNAMDAIPARDIGTMNSMLSAALTDFGTCDDGFIELPGAGSPMGSYDDILTKLASNCLAIVSLI